MLWALSSLSNSITASSARKRRFIRSARTAEIFGGTLPACTSAISRVTVSRTAIASSKSGKGVVACGQRPGVIGNVPDRRKCAFERGRGSTISVLVRPLLRPPIRPSSDALLGFAWMICADFLAGANLESGNSDMLLYSVLRLFKFLSGEERKAFLDYATEKAS